MADRGPPGPPLVTITGGGGARQPEPEPERPRRSLLLPLLLGAAVLAAVVAGAPTAPPSPPGPDCGRLCLDGDPVVVGVALPLTGVLAPFGEAQQRGITSALEEVNAAGGVQVAGTRRRVELLVRDSRSIPEVAGQQALAFARGPFGVVAMLGPCAPPVALVRVAEFRGLPLVTGCQPLPTLGPIALDHTWEVAPDEVDRATAVFAALLAAQDRRVALFLSNDRAADAWTAAAARAGFDLVGVYRPQGRGWGPAVRSAADGGAALVVAVTQPPEGVELWRELAAQGVDPEMAYASEAATGSAWYAAVGRRAEGTLTDAVGPLSPDGRGAAGADDAVAAASAALTDVLVDGLSRSASSQRGDVNTGLAQATGSFGDVPVSFGDDGRSRVPHRLARWEDGELVPLAPAP